MAGQSSGLKSLGLSFSTSKENAEAAALGYHKAYSKLTPVQQATVRLKLAQSELNKQFGTTKQDLQTNYGQWEKTGESSVRESRRNFGRTMSTCCIDCGEGCWTSPQRNLNIYLLQPKMLC